jgi:raffinose/stachyose/melibiose transport system permease protein
VTQEVQSGERAVTRPRTKRTNLSRSLVAWAFLLPTVTMVGVFTYWPAIRALEGAFTSWDGVSAPKWIGLQNFRQLFHDHIFGQSFIHLFWWTIIGIPTGMGASLFVALLIYRLGSSRAQYAFRVMFSLTLCLPGIIGLLSWANFYETGGVIDIIFHHLGLGHASTAWLADPKYALAAMILMGFPWVGAFSMLVFYAGLQAIPQEINDAAAVDGVGSLRRVWHVELPMIRGQLKVLLVLAVIGITQNLLPPLLLTQGGPGYDTYTPVLYMYNSAFTADQMGYALAIAFILFVISLILAIVTMRFLRGDTDNRRKVA